MISAMNDARENDQRPIRAAGAVLWRPDPDGPRLAVIHRPRYDDWSFPKGKAEPEEHALLTAVREVFEETGQRAVLGRRLPTVRYEVAGRPKQVRYWAARAAAGREFEPGDEVDELAWLTPLEARERLTWEWDVEVLDAFLSAPAATVPVVLLRHGLAKHRSERWQDEWSDGPWAPGHGDDDLLRPLAEPGRRQAALLARLVATVLPEPAPTPDPAAGLSPAHEASPLADEALSPAERAPRVLSSPARRCLDTVRPLGEALGTTVEIEPVLAQYTDDAAVPGAGAWLGVLLAEGRATVACSHLPVLQELMDGVLSDPQAERGPWINGKAWSAHEARRLIRRRLFPGGGWVLHLSPGTAEHGAAELVAVDRLRAKL